MKVVNVSWLGVDAGDECRINHWLRKKIGYISWLRVDSQDEPCMRHRLRKPPESSSFFKLMLILREGAGLPVSHVALNTQYATLANACKALGTNVPTSSDSKTL